MCSHCRFFFFSNKFSFSQDRTYDGWSFALRAPLLVPSAESTRARFSMTLASLTIRYFDICTPLVEMVNLGSYLSSPTLFFATVNPDGSSERNPCCSCVFCQHCLCQVSLVPTQPRLRQRPSVSFSKLWREELILK